MESKIERFDGMTIMSNQYGCPRPGLLDMRDCNMKLDGWDVICAMSGRYIVLENSGGFGYCQFDSEHLSDEEMDDLLLNMEVATKDRKNHIMYDPFRCIGPGCTEHIKSRLGM